MSDKHISHEHQLNHQIQTSREELTKLINSFLQSEITAFQFDEQLDVFRESDDPVIQYVVHEVWFHYDDCTDHLVCLTKQQWDFFQRLLLILAANCRIEFRHERRWSVRQPVACMFLGFYLVLAMYNGWNYQLLILAIPFSLVTIALSYLAEREEKVRDPFDPHIYPFATFSDLANAYYSTSFRKSRFPRHLETRTIRSDFSVLLNQFHTCLVWLFVPALVLLILTLPEERSHARVYAK